MHKKMHTYVHDTHTHTCTHTHTHTYNVFLAGDHPPTPVLSLPEVEGELSLYEGTPALAPGLPMEQLTHIRGAAGQQGGMRGGGGNNRTNKKRNSIIPGHKVGEWLLKWSLTQEGGSV